MTTTAVPSYTTKQQFRTAIITAMNDLRTRGNEPCWASVSRHIELSGILTEHDQRENPSADTGHTFQYVWQTTLSFVATDMKNDGILYREHGAPWILMEWGITTAQLSAEIYKRKVVAKTCTTCWCTHRPEVECW